MAVKKPLLFLFISLSQLFCSSAYAQTVLNFPRVISSAGTFTGIAVSNPTAAEVSVTFTAFQADGGMQNPITVKIAAGGQYAQVFSEMFGGSSFNGWVQATSSSKGITGFFLNGSAALTDLDGAGAIDPAAEFVLPLAVEDGGSKTEITIVNVNTEPATATVTLFGADGAILATKDVNLPSRGLVRQTLAAIFNNVDLRTASHAKVRSERLLIAHEVVADFLIPGSSQRRESITISGQSTTAATSYVLPQFVTGAGWLSLLGVVNTAGLAQEITLTAYKEDGSLWNLPSNPIRVSLGANAGLRTTAGQFFGFPSGTLATGWIEVRSSLGFVSSYIGYGNTTTPSFAAVSATESGAASQYQVFSHVAEGVGYFTGLTAVNPGTETAALEFYILRPDGTTVGKSAFTIPPKQRVGRLFSELLPASLTQVGGWAILRSSKPVIGAVLFGSTNGLALANVPQQTPAGDFLPPPQTTSAISGSVRSGGDLMADVQVILSGPVNATASTDGLGRYTFPQLPSGEYTVMATQPGVQFLPASQIVAVNRENRNGVGFEGGGLPPANAPSVQFVSPSSTLAGNHAFNVRVLGSNFTPASAVKLNGQAIATAFLSPSDLQAIIPAAQLGKPGTMQLSVETPPPGGGTSASLEFTINPVPANPLIEGRAAVGSFPAGVAIDTTANTALVTNQASDNVTVLDLKTLLVKANIAVGRSPAEGVAIHKAKNIALVANPGSNNISVINLATNRETQKIAVGRFPVGIAINATTDKAVVANADDNTVSVIDLNTFTVRGQIAVGSRPQGVAIQQRSNQAVVTNSGANTVSIIDLNTNSVLATIAAGQFPRGVSVNSITNVAVVANANSNDVSVIDLSARTVVYTVKVEIGPTSVAVHELTNTALITNSGILRGSTNYGVPTTVSVLDLGTRTITRTIPVGSAAFGLDVDQGNQKAVVANFGSNDVTLLRVPNPKPRIDDISPKTFPAGGGAFTLTVSGGGFVPSSVVTLNGNPLPTSYVSYTELRADVSTDAIRQLLGVRALELDTFKPNIAADSTDGQFTVEVDNQDGGSSGPPTTPAAGRIGVQTGVPVLVSLSPTEKEIGTGDLVLTVNGNNFSGTSKVSFSGVLYTPISFGTTQMTVTIPAASLAPGTTFVSIVNPALGNPPAGGGTSGALALTVNPPANPVPAVTRVTPSSLAAGSGAITINVEGSGFITSTTAVMGGVAGTVSGNTIQFILGAGQTGTPATLNGFISTPRPGGGSATFTVNVTNPIPTISGFSPDKTDAGSASLPIQVTGTNFRPDSQVTVEDTPIPTHFDSATQLTGTIPESFLRRSREVHISVRNPAPGGGLATGGVFAITSPQPVLTGVTPSQTPSQPISAADLTVQLSGRGFIDNSIVSIGSAVLRVSFNSATSLSATIPGTLLTRAGILRIVVTNPPPGGGSSQGAEFLVINTGTPAINSITPSTVLNGQTQAIRLTGINFGPGSVVLLRDTPLPTAASGETDLDATLPAAVATGPADIVVRKLIPTGAVLRSQPFSISIVNPAPVIVSLDPNPAPNHPGQLITVQGTGFVPNSRIEINGLQPDTAYRSATTVSFVLPAMAADVSSVNVQVINAAPGGGPSNAFALTLSPRAPTVTSIYPSSGQRGTTVRLEITGSDFVNGAVVNFGSTIVPATFISSTAVSATLALGTFANTIFVSVANPGGATSNSVSFVVTAPAPPPPPPPQNPSPSITSISPPRTVAGSADTAITISGSNFLSSSVVTFASTVLTPTSQSATSIVVTVPASLLVTAGNVSVTVTNPAPGGGTASQTFTIDPASTFTLSPSNGSIAGGTRVLITGSNFNSSSVIVKFGTALGVGAMRLSSTQVAVFSPTHTNGSVDITLTVGGASQTRSNAFDFERGKGGSAFVAGQNMTVTRYNSAAVLLNDARVLVSGGTAESGYLSSTDIAGATGVFSAGPVMTTERAFYTATILADGRVLIAGGYNAVNPSALNSTEVLDAAATSFTAGAALPIGRYQHTATLLADGRILVVGGYGPTSQPAATAEIFDPVSNTWSKPISMLSAHVQHQATLMADGRVLVTGNSQTAEIFDPATNTFGLAATMGESRSRHLAVALNNGNVLIAGGVDGNFRLLNTAEIFDGTAFKSTTGQLPKEIHTPVGTLLDDGKVLIAGGDECAGGCASNSASTFDPASGLFTATGGMVQGRIRPSIIRLPNGTVLIAGGFRATNTTEVFGPAPVPTVTTLSPPNAAAQGKDFTLKVTGSNFVRGSVVRWNGSDRTTTYVSASELNAAISATDIAVTGTAQVTVFNPSPGGGSSGAVSFSIFVGVYFNNFEGAVGPEWSKQSASTTPLGARKFLGEFGTETVSLKLPSIPSHTSLTVSFDLYVLKSWDGNGDLGSGPDIFDLNITSGPQLLHTTFGNFPGQNQAYPGSYPGPSNPYHTGAVEIDTLGYTFYGDTVYHVTYTVPDTASSLTLNFSASLPDGAAGLDNESWGIDNVIIGVVPTSSISDLTISKTHVGSFTQGQSGALYSITVSNSGTASTSGMVTVVDTLPAGLTATAISGTGWTCTLASFTCTRTDALAVNASYPPIAVTVNVAAASTSLTNTLTNAINILAVSVTNLATVSGGGELNTANDIAQDLTIIKAATDNLASNGSFDTDATGWSLSSACNDSRWVASAGNAPGVVQLNECGQFDSDPTAKQTLGGLTPGETYRISVDVLLHTDISANRTSFGIFIDTEPGNPIFLGEFIDGTWQTATAIFTATSSIHTLIFAAELDTRTPGVVANSDVSYYIDNVSLVVSPR
jgi:YVTN family beta-propeller protein